MTTYSTNMVCTWMTEKVYKSYELILNNTLLILNVLINASTSIIQVLGVDKVLCKGHQGKHSRSISPANLLVNNHLDPSVNNTQIKLHSSQFVARWFYCIADQWCRNSHGILCLSPHGGRVTMRKETKDQSRYAPSQWGTSLHCNDVSHWLGAYLDWSL